LQKLALNFNPIITEWLNYYSIFGKLEFRKVMEYLNEKLVKWAMRKYKKLRDEPREAQKWLLSIAKQNSSVFAHWKHGCLNFSFNY